MADVWSRLGIKPYEADPAKVKLTLDDAPKAQPKPRTPATLTPGTIFSEDGFIPDVLRTAGDTGLNYMNLGAAALNSVGADIDRNKIIDAIAAVRGEQEKSEARTDSPMRAAEKAKIKAQMAAADGVVENIMAGGNAARDMLMHPIENSGKIVGGVLDPLNAASFGAGAIAAKTAAKLGGAKLARIGGAATAGAVTNAPVNAIQEGSFAAARGEDWQKASEGAFGGGAVAGMIMGGAPGVFSKPHAAAIDPNAPIKEAMDDGIDMNGNPREARMGADGTYRPFDYPANPNDGSGGAGGSATAFDIGFKREPIDIDAEVKNIAHTKLIGLVDNREMDVREESAQAQAQITQMIGSGMDRQTIATAMDNMITPSREDMTITGLLNNNTPLPSRLSGVRPIMLLENSIKTAVENPAIARTNKEFYDVLVAQGVDKPYANIMTSAYAAKDPQILRDHIYTTLANNADKIVDHDPIRQEVTAIANEVVSANESEAKIDALMPQLEFHPSKEKDNSIFFNYDGHEYFVNAHGAMGKVGIGEDGRRRYFAHDLDQRTGLTYGEGVKLAERIYKLKGKEVDNTAIITQADRDANSQRVFVDYLTKGQTFKDENIDLPKAFQDFWKPTKPQSIDEFKKYVSRNKEKYTLDTPKTILEDTKTPLFEADPKNLDNDVWQSMTDEDKVDLMHKIGIRNVATMALPKDFDKFNDSSKAKLQEAYNPKTILEDTKTVSKPTKTLPSQAQAIKDASEIPVGGSEDAAKLAAQQGFKPQLDAQYKKMNAKTRAELEQYYANAPEDLYGKALATTNEIHGNDVGSANMSLIDARAKAMGMSSDEFMKQNNLTVENLTKEDGAQHIKDLQEGDAAFQLSENVINGMVEMGFKSTGEMRNTIKLFSTADVSTLPHELMHVFERTLSGDERAAMDHAFRDYEAGEARSEAAARGFEAYLGEGKAPTKELQLVFDKFKTWLRDLWEMVFHTPGNGFKLNDEQRAFYRAMMGDKEAIKEVFGDIDAAPIEKDMIAAKILDEMPEAATVTKGENTQGGLFGADDGIIEQPKLFSDKVEVDTLKVPDNIKATPQEYRTTIREMAKGESLTHPMIAEQIKRSKTYIEAQQEAIKKEYGSLLFQVGDPKAKKMEIKSLADSSMVRELHQEAMMDLAYRDSETKWISDGLKKMMEDC